MKKIMLIFCFILFSSCSIQEIKDQKGLSQIENNATKLNPEIKNENSLKDLNDVTEVEIKGVLNENGKQTIFYKTESYIYEQNSTYKYGKDYYCGRSCSLTSGIERIFYFYNKKTGFEIASKQNPIWHDGQSIYKFGQSCIGEIGKQKCYKLDQLLLNKNDFILIENF